EVVLVDDRPVVAELPLEGVELGSLQGRNAALAGDALHRREIAAGGGLRSAHPLAAVAAFLFFLDWRFSLRLFCATFLLSFEPPLSLFPMSLPFRTPGSRSTIPRRGRVRSRPGGHGMLPRGARGRVDPSEGASRDGTDGANQAAGVSDPSGSRLPLRGGLRPRTRPHLPRRMGVRRTGGAAPRTRRLRHAGRLRRE